MSPIQPTLYLSDQSLTRGYASIRAADQLSIAGDLTLEAWLSPQKDQTSTILSYVDERSGYQLGYDAHWRPYAVRRGRDGAPTLLQRARVPLGSSWSHLAASYSSSYGLELRDGVHVDCGGGKDMAVRDALTVEAWVRFDVLPGPGEEQVVVSRWDEDRLDRGFKRSITDTQLRFQVVTDEPSADAGSLHSGPIAHQFTVGRWHHLTAVCAENRALNMLEFSPPDENYLDVGPLTKATLSSCTVEMWIAPEVWNGEPRVLFEGTYSSSSNSTSVTALRLEYNPTKEVYSSTSLRLIVNGSQVMQIGLGACRPRIPAITTWPWSCVQRAIACTRPKAIATEYSTALFPADARADRWVFGASLVSGAARDFYAGAMRDLRIWSVARSSAEVIDGMTRRFQGDEDGLIGYWPLSHSPGSGGAVINLVDRRQTTVHRRVPAQPGDPAGRVTWVQREIGGAFKLAIDNSRSSSSPNNGGAPIKTDAPLLIGAAASGAGLSTLTGAVDDVRIWRSERKHAQLDYFRNRALIDADKDERLAAAGPQREPDRRRAFKPRPLRRHLERLAR